MVEVVKTYKEFIDIVSTLKYKNSDISEAMLFGHNSIKSVYESIKYKDLCRYFVLKDKNGTIVCTIALDHCRTLHFFVTQDLTIKNTKTFLEDIKHLAYFYSKKYDCLLVNVANFYKKANKLVKIVGFEPYDLYEDHTIYIYRKR